ncbi:MAG TPA: DUF6504 family protein [Abditibacterium sp.]
MRQACPDPLGAPIHVEARSGLPHRIVWGGKPFRVLSIEAIWCVEGKWWLDSGRSSARRHYFRLCILAPGGVEKCVEVYRQGPVWKLWRIAD